MMVQLDPVAELCGLRQIPLPPVLSGPVTRRCIKALRAGKVPPSVGFCPFPPALWGVSVDRAALGLRLAPAAAVWGWRPPEARPPCVPRVVRMRTGRLARLLEPTGAAATLSAFHLQRRRGIQCHKIRGKIRVTKAEVTGAGCSSYVLWTPGRQGLQPPYPLLVTFTISLGSLANC